MTEVAQARDEFDARVDHLLQATCEVARAPVEAAPSFVVIESI
jgi:hypothetical protein